MASGTINKLGDRLGVLERRLGLQRTPCWARAIAHSDAEAEAAIEAACAQGANVIVRRIVNHTDWAR
jgi:hypothetical protein